MSVFLGDLFQATWFERAGIRSHFLLCVLLGLQTSVDVSPTSVRLVTVILGRSGRGWAVQMPTVRFGDLSIFVTSSNRILCIPFGERRLRRRRLSSPKPPNIMLLQNICFQNFLRLTFLLRDLLVSLVGLNLCYHSCSRVIRSVYDYLYNVPFFGYVGMTEPFHVSLRLKKLVHL